MGFFSPKNAGCLATKMPIFLNASIGMATGRSAACQKAFFVTLKSSLLALFHASRQKDHCLSVFPPQIGHVKVGVTVFAMFCFTT